MPTLIPVDHDPFSTTQPIDYDPFKPPSLWDKGKALMRPAYETVGKPIGEGLGLAGGFALGGIPGAALGYGAVKGAEKLIDVGTGSAPKETYGGAFKRTGKDIVEGASAQMLGMAIPQGIQTGVDLAKIGASKILPKGSAIYQKALKIPPTLLNPKNRVKVTGTALKEKIPLNEPGYDKLMTTIKTVDNEVDEVIKTNAEKPVDYDKILEKAQGALKAQKNKFNQLEREEAVKKAIDKFKRDTGGKLNVLEAQSFKLDANRQLEGFFNKWQKGEFGPNSEAETDAMNAIRSGLKEEIERVAPEIKGLNKRLGDLLELQPHLMRRINGISNAEPITLSEWLSMGIGAGSGGVHGGLAGYAIKKGLATPRLSQIAIGLNNMEQNKAQGISNIRGNFWNK